MIYLKTFGALFYRRPPASAGSGNLVSELTVTERIQVKGRLQGGSLNLHSKSVTITGTVDVSGGGYLATQGPGQYTTSLCIMTVKVHKAYACVLNSEYFYLCCRFQVSFHCDFTAINNINTHVYS